MKKFIKWLKGLFKSKYTQLKREDIISDDDISGGYFEAIKELQNKIECVRIAELRKHISIAAMQGLLSGIINNDCARPAPSNIAKWSVAYANALIEALEKENGKRNI